MKLRANLVDENGQLYAWYSTAQKLERVLKAYEDERVVVYTTDFLNKDDVDDLGNVVDEQSILVDCLYLSSIEENLHPSTAKEQPCAMLWDNLTLLPTSYDALILRTAMISVPSDLRLQAPAINEDPVFRQIFLRWHYNIEQVKHHRVKLATDPQYQNMGWSGAILSKSVYEPAKITGVSYLSI